MSTAAAAPKTEVIEVARQYRYLEIGDLVEVRAATENDPAVYDFALSSEYEVQRWFGRETLAHDEGAIDMRLAKRGLSLLLDHWGEQVGVVENVRLEKGVLRGNIRFSKSELGREIEQDVKDKIRKFISIGYDPVKMIAEEKPGGAMRDRKVRVTRWAPLEASIVKIPADPTVGTDRSGAGAAGTHPVEIEGLVPEREVRSMEATTTAPAATATVTTPTISVEDLRKQANERAAAIYKLCRDNEIEQEKADEFVRGDKSLHQVGYDILNLRLEKPRSTPAAEILEAMSPGERQKMKRYRRTVALRNALAVREGRSLESGVEKDWHELLLKRCEKEGYSHRGGMLMPIVFETQAELQERQERALDTKTVTKGSELIQEQPGSFIEIFRNMSVAGPLGITSLPGLTGGPIVFPKQTGTMTAQWIGENPGAGVSASDLALGVVQLLAKTLMARTSYSRQLLMQSTPAVDTLIDSDAAQVLALASDKSLVHGKGADGQPTGVYMWPNVLSKAFGGSVDFTELVDALGQLADANAPMTGIKLLTTPLLAASLKRTPVLAAAGSEMIWTGPLNLGQVAGYGSVASGQVSKVMNGSDETGGTSHGLVWGVWSDMIQGFWGVVEAIVDPYTMADKAMIAVTWFMLVDQIIRHPEAFLKGTGATP